MVDECLPEDGANLLQLGPPLLLIVVPADDYGGFESVMVAVSALVEGSDNLDIVLVCILSPKHDADGTKSIQRLNRECVGGTAMLLIATEKLNVDLDDFVVPVILLVEVNEGQASFGNADVLDAEGDQAGTVDAEENFFGLLKVL